MKWATKQLLTSHIFIFIFCNYVRATSHTRLRACDRYTLSTLIGGKGRASLKSSLYTTLEGTNRVCECKMDVKSTWIPTWHQMDHVFMVTWIVFKNHLLEVSLTQNWKTMSLRTLTTVGFFFFL